LTGGIKRFGNARPECFLMSGISRCSLLHCAQTRMCREISRNKLAVIAFAVSCSGELRGTSTNCCAQTSERSAELSLSAVRQDVIRIDIRSLTARLGECVLKIAYANVAPLCVNNLKALGNWVPYQDRLEIFPNR
jgi:hypothetical protein